MRLPLLSLILSIILPNLAHGFQTTSFLPSSPISSCASSKSRHSFLKQQFTNQKSNHLICFSSETDAAEKSSTKTNNSSSNAEEGLSEMDARVLREMLQSEKLDLETEADMKKLLERGVKKEAPQAKKKTPKNDDSEFKSEALQTLTNTKLWQAVSRKAGDWFESLTLAIANKIERDAMTLAALGVFAWERAVRDVARALPAAGNATKATRGATNKPFLLSSKSSVEDMTTPADEWKSVGTAVRDILKSGGADLDSRSASSTGVLKSAATSRQDKRNFQRAYQRASIKAKANSNTNPIRVTQRATSGVVDTAWQLKRELQAEQNVAGYKTKEVQAKLEAASENTRQLLQGAQETWKLERAKARRLLEADAEVEEDFEIVDNSQAQQSSFVAPEETQVQKEARQRRERQEQERIQQQQLQQRMMREEQQRRVTEKREQAQQTLVGLQLKIQQDCTSLQQKLQNCIVNPEETWLRPAVIDGVSNFDQDMIRQVVTEMIATRNLLKDILKLSDFEIQQEFGIDMAKLDFELQQLAQVPVQLEELQGHAQQAVSLGAAQALQEELLVNGNDDSESIFLRLEEVLQAYDQARNTLAEVEKEESDISQQPQQQPQPASPSMEEPQPFFAARPSRSAPKVDTMPHSYVEDATTPTEPFDFENDETDSEIVDVVPEAVMYAFATTPIEATATADAVATVSMAAELVTDDDFEAAVGETKYAVAVTDNEDDEANSMVDQQEQDNFLIQLLLRALDIIFFLLEKTFTVAIPTVLSSGTTASSRLENVAKGGLGTKGWERIGNAKEGAKRY